MERDNENPDLTTDEEPGEGPPTEAGSGELDEDALQEGEDKLDQAGGGH